MVPPKTENKKSLAPKRKASSWPWRKPRNIPQDAWQVIQNTLTESIQETRRSRRWRIFFRLAYLLVFVWILVLLSINTGSFKDSLSFSDLGGKHIALIKLTGFVVDSAVSPTGINADSVNEALREAFDNPNAAAIILSINSPGGSPVQAGQIFDELVRYVLLNQPRRSIRLLRS